MGLSLWNLYEAGLLVLNAIAVLHEERFLARVGWGRNQAMTNQGGFGGIPQEPGLKANMMNLIHSIRTVMRIPLIILNILTILFKLIAG